MRLRFVTATLLIIATLFMRSSALAEEQVLNGIAAIVNSDVITYSQVEEVVGTRERSMAGQLQGQELADKVKDLRMQAVQLLIDNQLIIQDFTKNKFSIPDYIVDQQVQARIKEQFGGDRAAFIRTLAAQGMTMDKFRTMVRDDIIVQAMRQKNVHDDSIISPSQIADYYKKSISDYTTPEKIHLRMIVIKKNGDTGKQMAEEVRQKVIGGADFDKLAQMYSEDSTQDSGGDWGWIDKTVLNESLTKIAFSLKPGQVSDVVELAGSYYLLYVQEKQPEVVKSMKDVHDDIENKLLEQQRQQQEEKWIGELRKKAYIWIDGVTTNDGGATPSGSEKTPHAEEHAAKSGSPSPQY
jgi:parvulin-like peptidyl-prolyl isomerase